MATTLSAGYLAGRILIALVLLNAAVGIGALVVSGDKQIGDFEAHILLTTLAVSSAAVAILPCVLAWERLSLRPFQAFSLLSIAAELLALGLLVAVIWTADPADSLTRPTASAVAAGIAASLINLLSLATLQRGYEWVRLNAYALACLMAGQAVLLVWSDDPGDTSIRLLIGTIILLTAACVAVPTLQRLQPPAPDLPGGEARFCPRCGRPLDPDSAGRCGRCGARFTVEFR